MNSFFTKEQHWQDKWDDFLQQSERGLYLQLSDWIKSYEVFGFEYQLFLVTEKDAVVGGCAIVIAKFSFFKFYIVPCGPVIIGTYEDQIDFIITELKSDARKKRCCYFQMSLPLLQNEATPYDYSIREIPPESIYFSGNLGTKFKYIIPLYGYRLAHLEGKDYESVFLEFSKNCKRNVTKAKTENFTFRFVDSPEELAQGYNCFVQNGKEKGYPVRSYESIRPALEQFIKKDFAKMGCCFLNGKIIGAIYVLKAGNRLTYISGGVLKDYQHLNVSVFMHNYLIEYSLAQGYKSYDIAMGGSPGVIKFKEGFGTHLHEFVSTRHWILQPLPFRIYTLVEKKLKKHKAKVAGFLLKLKKNRR